MTPVPKGLSKIAQLRWRRAVARGASPVRGARVATQGQIMYEATSGPFIDYPSDPNSLDRHTRGVE